MVVSARLLIPVSGMPTWVKFYRRQSGSTIR
jgi:hypothetical protein